MSSVKRNFLNTNQAYLDGAMSTGLESMELSVRDHPPRANGHAVAAEATTERVCPHRPWGSQVVALIRGEGAAERKPGLWRPAVALIPHLLIERSS